MSSGADEPAPPPWLERHRIRLGDGRHAGVWIGGRGVPLVMVHGFTAVPKFYLQTLARVAKLGFRVVAIEAPGHGQTDGLPLRTGDLAGYADTITEVIDQLGIERIVLMGHSMGGRLVTHVAATRADNTIALVLIDPIVGAAWDRLLRNGRYMPPMLTGVMAALVLDSLAPGPLVRRPAQSMTLARLALPTLASHVARPWRLAGPTLAILRSGRSAPMLDMIADAGVPVTVIHGERDLIVPLQAGRDAARRTRGTLVVVSGGMHSWLLVDPGSLPVILGHGVVAEVASRLDLAVDASGWDTAEAEALCVDPAALLFELAERSGEQRVTELRDRAPGHEWRLERFAEGA